MNTDHLGTDLALVGVQAALRPVYRLDDHRRTTREDGRVRRREDLALVSGVANLDQAVVARLLTPRGELAALGHPSYGSRLHQLIGRRNTASTRDLARLYVLEALQQEPRLAGIEALEVVTTPGTRDQLSIRLRATPVGSAEVVDLGPFVMELAS